MSTLSLNDRVLGVNLGLGDLLRGEVCHGYANACVCSECVVRAERPVPVEPVRFPWEELAA